jgi:hypothetical protein
MQRWMDGWTDRQTDDWGEGGEVVVNVCVHCFQCFVFSKDVIVQLYIMSVAQKVLPCEVRTNLLSINIPVL